jgi:hypothetical protein
MITQVINAIRIQDLSTQMFALQRGLFELETWADNDWFVILPFFHFFLSILFFASPGYKSLLVFVRNQAQTLINQRRTFFPSSAQLSPTKKSDQSTYFFFLSRSEIFKI